LPGMFIFGLPAATISRFSSIWYVVVEMYNQRFAGLNFFQVFFVD
jgi:hypothetical protein